MWSKLGSFCTKNWGLFLLVGVVLVGLYASHPLRAPALPHGTDTLTHLYTLVPLDELFEQGVFFSRWAPFQASGFGAPLFNYYAPLAYYVAQAFHVLGADVVAALRLTLALSLVGAAVGIWLWVRDAFDALAGLVAAVAFVCGPYMLFNAYVRGGLNEQVALGLMPWILWTLRRLAMTGKARFVILSALAHAGLILAHNLTTLLFSPVLLAYTLLLAVAPPPGAEGKRGTPLLAFAGGLGLSAFFWIPMLLEWNEIVPELLHRGSEFDYSLHFVPARSLFLPLTGAAPRPALAVATIVLALLGLVLLLWREPKRRLEAGLFGLVAAGYTLMALPLSAGLWDLLRPVLQFLQFPHRFLSVVSICLAFLAGGGIWAARRGLRRGKLARPILIVLSVVLIILLLLPSRVLQKVRHYPVLPELDAGFVMRKARESGEINTTYALSFLPKTVQELPPFELLAQDGPKRLDQDSLPADVTIVDAGYGALRYDLWLAAEEPFQATFNTFHFPGWRAHIDGREVPVTADVPCGRIAVEVPAGEHRLEVWFGTTPPRRLAGWVSLLSLLGLGVVAVGLAGMKR